MIASIKRQSHEHAVCTVQLRRLPVNRCAPALGIRDGQKKRLRLLQAYRARNFVRCELDVVQHVFFKLTHLREVVGHRLSVYPQISQIVDSGSREGNGNRASRLTGSAQANSKILLTVVMACKGVPIHQIRFGVTARNLGIVIFHGRVGEGILINLQLLFGLIA